MRRQVQAAAFLWALAGLAPAGAASGPQAAAAPPGMAASVLPWWDMITASFVSAAEAMPEPGDRQILVQNLWLSLDAGTRMWMTAREDSYMAPTPLGSKVIGFVLGRVVASRHPDYAPGDLVRAYGQWADHSVQT